MKKIPQRMCVVTHTKTDKRNLLRIVKDKEGNIFIDLTGKQNGKGAYLTKDKTVIEEARKKKVLNHIFECEIEDTFYDEILKLI